MTVTLVPVAAAAGEVEDLADAIAGAVALEHPVPDVRGDLPEHTAYEVQSRWVRAVYGTDFAGYKAGLTSVQTQQRFGVAAPVLGILPGVARLATGSVIVAKPGLKVEVEVGFLVGTDDAPAAMLPVVEVPRLSFAAPEKLELADLVASDVSAYRFVEGRSQRFDAAVRETKVTLTRDGVLLNEAVATDAMGDPFESYRWMVAKIRSLGWRLSPGMIMMTGALGRIADGEPGTYIASYDRLGEVTFTIR